MVGFNGTNIIHLEASDFKNNTLSYNGSPVKGVWIVMVQTNHCHFCNDMKPTFTKLANKIGSNNTVQGPIFATIQIEEEDALAKMLPKIINTQLAGVPAILRFENGKFAAMVVGGKNEGQLVEFMNH